MAGSRALGLFTVAVVLVVAWYASREALGMGVAVAILGLSMAYARGVVAIPAAVGLAAAALYLPGVVVVFVLVGGLYFVANVSADGPRPDALWP